MLKVSLLVLRVVCETPLTTESVGVVGLTTDLISEAHKQSLQLHIPVPSDEFKEEVLHELKQDFQVFSRANGRIQSNWLNVIMRK